MAVIVSDVDTPPPAKIQPFSDLTIASRTLNRHAQYLELDDRLYREIETHVHPISAE
jgi:hypothetical protein